MHTYIALLRGINVGGHNKLPMQELKSVLATLALSNVRTYIQSGNVVFQSERADSAALAAEITAAIGQSHGFSPAVLLLTAEELRAAMAANPFPAGEEEPKSLHLFFLDAPPTNVDLASLAALKKANERYQLVGKVFYLHAPDGIGRSKLAERFGRGWDVTITARNWRTVGKVMELVQNVEQE